MLELVKAGGWPMIPLLLTGCTADHDTATLPAAATTQAETLVVTPEQIGETYTTTIIYKFSTR